MSCGNISKFIIPLCLLSASHAFNAYAEKNNYQLAHQKEQVVIDGVMDESVWLNATKMDLRWPILPRLFSF